MAHGPSHHLSLPSAASYDSASAVSKIKGIPQIYLLASSQPSSACSLAVFSAVDSDSPSTSCPFRGFFRKKKAPAVRRPDERRGGALHNGSFLMPIRCAEFVSIKGLLAYTV